MNFFFVALSLAVASQALLLDNHVARGAIGAEQERSLLQTYDNQLSGGSAKATPVTRVVNLLKEMSKTLNKEQEEDEALFNQLSCWCNNNKYEKNGAAEAATAKIADLEATIEMLTARSSELNTKIKELEAGVASDKAGLAEASALRAKQLKEFHGMELDNIAALENLKAAIVVLSRHNGAFAQMPASDASVVKRAMKSVAAFVQAHHGQEYMPSYSAQSGEIFGVLKQLQDEMKAGLSEAQQNEATRAATFAELRAAKTSEIEAGEKMAETKEDELAKTDMDNAEAKEDLGQTQAQLSEDQKFLMNLGKMCAEGDANFAKRKASRLNEIQAVSQTIEILTGDDARDAMDTTFSFMQTARNTDQRRNDAAAVLRRGAAKSHSPELSMLASSVELDAFTKVKAMIDTMIATLKTQQGDEVKKNNWCKDELQENEMQTMKTTDLKADLEAKAAQLESAIKTLSEEIEKAHLDIGTLNVELQRASENRKKENLDFQTVVADQTATAEILAKALDKLAKFYDDAAFAQTAKRSSVLAQRQTPPVAQMTYKKSSGSTGVMSMIEKLILDTKEITGESKKAEGDAQAAYEALVADTNASIADLMKSITSKTKAKAQNKKDLSLTNSDHAGAVTELEGLGKYNADLHGECDYVLKNFGIRQSSRAAEIESLQQAKQILNGANLS